MVTPDSAIEVQDKRGLRYCQIDNDLMRASELGPYAKLIYAILCGYANINTFSCYPKLSTLAKDAGISRPTVIKALKELADNGAVAIIHRADSDGRDAVNQYIIKDWRSEQPNTLAAVNDVDTGVNDVDRPVNDVATSSKPRLPRAVNDVDTKEREFKERVQKENSSSVATQQKITRGKKAKSEKAEKPDKPENPNIKVVVDTIDLKFGKSRYKYWRTQVTAIERLLDDNYEPVDIVGCWDALFKRYNRFIPLTWVQQWIADYLRLGGKLPQRGNANDRRSDSQTMGHNATGAAATGRPRNVTRDLPDSFDEERALGRIFEKTGVL